MRKPALTLLLVPLLVLAQLQPLQSMLGSAPARADEAATTPTAVSPPTSVTPSDASPEKPGTHAASSRLTQLTQEDQEALAKGPIPTGRYIAGGIVGTAVVGFGVGQAIQGRYGDTGWIFTVGEVASTAVLVVGVTQSTFNCTDATSNNPFVFTPVCNVSISPVFWVGLGALVGFRVWEIIDLWLGPHRQNAAYRRAKAKQGGVEGSWSPFVAPASNDSLALGLQYRF
jgi:hypothetical protein